MASWTDGVEYAPTDRPGGFAMPRTAPLSQAPREVSPAQGQPVQPPATFETPRQAVPLERLVPPTGPTRDPREAFRTAGGERGGVWGAGHADAEAPAAFDPHAPMTTTALLDPVEQFAPPSGAPVSTLPPPSEAPLAEGDWDEDEVPPGRAAVLGATLLDLVRDVGTPVVVALVLGVLVRPLALPMLVAALVAVTPNERLGDRLRLVLASIAAGALVLAFGWNPREEITTSLGMFAQFGCLGGLGHALWYAARRRRPA